jgi:hypothetical protein
MFVLLALANSQFMWRAAQKSCESHMRPAGRRFQTAVLDEWNIYEAEEKSFPEYTLPKIKPSKLQKKTRWNSTGNDSFVCSALIAFLSILYRFRVFASFTAFTRIPFPFLSFVQPIVIPLPSPFSLLLS